MTVNSSSKSAFRDSDNLDIQASNYILEMRLIPISTEERWFGDVIIQFEALR